MIITIHGRDRISGTSTDFKAKLPISIDESRCRYAVYLEQVIATGVDGDGIYPYLRLFSSSLNPTSKLYNTANSHGLLLSIPISVIDQTSNNHHYNYQKTNSIADFELSSINQIQDFKLLSNTDAAIGGFSISIRLNLVKLD